MKHSLAVVLCTVAISGSLAAQGAGPAAKQMMPKAAAANPLTDSVKAAYTSVKGNITKSAAAVGEKGYMFKPAGVAPEVRNFAQMVGHIANANFTFCAPLMGEAMKGETGPGGVDFEKKTAKADLQKGLADSFAFCDKAFDSVNDRNAAQAVDKAPIGATTRLGLLAYNNAHDWEHYGNLVTYMRAMGMVPPSSQK